MGAGVSAAQQNWAICSGNGILWTAVRGESYQHPAPGAPGVRPAHNKCVVYFMNDGDEVIALQL